MINPIKKKIIVNSKKNKLVKLKRRGKRNVNSMSYKIKKTHNIEKFKLIWMFNSDNVRNPHS